MFFHRVELPGIPAAMLDDRNDFRRGCSADAMNSVVFFTFGLREAALVIVA